MALNKDRGHIRISPNLEQLLCNFSKNTWSICTRCITPDVVVPHKDNMAKKCFSATSFIASALWSLEDAILSFSIFYISVFLCNFLHSSIPLRRKFLSHFTFLVLPSWWRKMTIYDATRLYMTQTNTQTRIYNYSLIFVIGYRHLILVSF